MARGFIGDAFVTVEPAIRVTVTKDGHCKIVHVETQEEAIGVIDEETGGQLADGDVTEDD